MATTTTINNHNEVEQFIFRELQSINDEYDETFTPSQVVTMVKFIAADYGDRRIQIRADISVQHVYDHVPRFLAYGYLNQLLEKLGQNSPRSIIENHVELLTFLIRELKGYFDGALWLIQLESFVKEYENYVEKVEATEEFVKEIFQDRLKSIEDEKKRILVELRLANALSNCTIELEEEISDDAVIEYLVYTDVIKCVFEQEMKHVQDMIREVQLDVKPVLEFEAKYKLKDLEFNIFSTNIIQKVKRSESMDDDLDWLEGPSKGIKSTVEGTTSKGNQSSLEGQQVKETNPLWKAQQVKETNPLWKAQQVKETNPLWKAQVKESNPLLKAQQVKEANPLRKAQQVKETNPLWKAQVKESNPLLKAQQVKEANPLRKAQQVKETNPLWKAQVKEGNPLLMTGCLAG